MLSATDHFNNDFSTTCKKIPRYSGELASQIADRFVALHYFHSVFVHGVIKLSFSNKFSSHQWVRYVSINRISTHVQLMRKRTFPCCLLYCGGLLRDSGVQTSLLNDCAVTKRTFCIVFLCFIFVQIPSFSFQLWGLVMRTTVVSYRE